jgi:hypothetical protein
MSGFYIYLYTEQPTVNSTRNTDALWAIKKLEKVDCTE